MLSRTRRPTKLRGQSNMMQTVMEDKAKEREFQEKSSTEIETIRQFIVDTAYSIQDEKLLKMLYIRAKTLKNL